MEAIVYTRYRPPEVLYLQEIAKPIPPGNQVPIRVHAITVPARDPMMRSFTFLSSGRGPSVVKAGHKQAVETLRSTSAHNKQVRVAHRAPLFSCIRPTNGLRNQRGGDSMTREDRSMTADSSAIADPTE